MKTEQAGNKGTETQGTGKIILPKDLTPQELLVISEFKQGAELVRGLREKIYSRNGDITRQEAEQILRVNELHKEVEKILGRDISQIKELLGPKFFGKEAYKELLGIDLEVGPLRGLTVEYLNSRCPVKNDGTLIKDSNVALVWVPEIIPIVRKPSMFERIKGFFIKQNKFFHEIPATVNSLAPIINERGVRLGRITDPRHAVVYKDSWALTDGKNEPVYSQSVKGHWALVWLQEAPNTRASEMTFEIQDKIFKEFQDKHNKGGIVYDTAEAFSTFLGLTLTYLKTGVRNPADFNWLCCKEELNSIKRADGVGGRALLGDFISRGLIADSWRGFALGFIGRAVSRKLRSPELVEG
jgi:hypothetical protein